MTPMDFITGQKKRVEIHLREAGFERVSSDTWRKGGLSIRWVSSTEHLRGIDGEGRRLIVLPDAPDGMKLEGRLRRFSIVRGADDLPKSVNT